MFILTWLFYGCSIDSAPMEPSLQEGKPNKELQLVQGQQQQQFFTLSERNIFVYANTPPNNDLALELLGVYGDGKALFSAVIYGGGKVFTPSLRANPVLKNDLVLVGVDANGVTLQESDRNFRLELKHISE